MQAIQNADGRLELFARSADGALVHTWQVAPSSGPYSGWESLGFPHPELKSPDGGFVFGNLTSVPAVARNADGRLEAFVTAGASAVHSDLSHIWQIGPGGPWSSWGSLGMQLKLTAPAVGQNADGRLEVFACTPDNTLWHIWQTAPGDGWSRWAPLGGSMRGAPVVAENADGRLEVFAWGTDFRLQHIWQTSPGGNWSTWGSLGGPRDGAVLGAPSVGRNADGRLEVFSITSGAHFGVLGHIWQVAPSNGWSGWVEDLLVPEELEGPGVAPNADGCLELFGRGRGEWRDPIHQWQVAPSNGWSADALSLGGQWTSAPVAVQNADGRLEVFARGLDYKVQHIWQVSPNDGWSAWDRLPDCVVSDVGRTLFSGSGVVWGNS